MNAKDYKEYLIARIERLEQQNAFLQRLVLNLSEKDNKK